MEEPADRTAAEETRASAREWHKLQLAALGFIGLCGVLDNGSGPVPPIWLQTLSGLLVLAGLLVAMVAIMIVALVAWPLGPTDGDSAGRVRLGIALTFVAVGLTTLGTMASWWPSDPTGAVWVTTSSGSACGTVIDSGRGVLELEVSGQRQQVPFTHVLGLQPTAGC